MKIDTVGLSCARSDDCIIADLEKFINQTLDDMPEDIIMDEDKIAENIRIPLRRFVLDILGLRPKTTVHVTLLDM